MEEQRRRDETVLKGGAGETSAEELHNSGGPKIGDQKDSKLGFGAPRFGDWDSNSSDAGDSYTHIFNKVREEKESLEFGRDTNRLAYFSVTAFNVLGDTQIIDYGGGGARTRELVAGPLLEQDRSTADGGGDGSRQILKGDVANNGNGGGEMAGELVVQERDSGKKRIGGAGRGLRWWDKWCYCWHCG